MGIVRMKVMACGTLQCMESAYRRTETSHGWRQVHAIRPRVKRILSGMRGRGPKRVAASVKKRIGMLLFRVPGQINSMFSYRIRMDFNRDSSRGNLSEVFKAVHKTCIDGTRGVHVDE